MRTPEEIANALTAVRTLRDEALRSGDGTVFRESAQAVNLLEWVSGADNAFEAFVEFSEALDMTTDKKGPDATTH